MPPYILHKQGGKGPIVIRLPKLALNGMEKKVLLLSLLYFEQIRLQSITSEFTQLMFGHMSDTNVYVLTTLCILLRYEFGELVCKLVVEDGISMYPVEGSMDILPPDFATMLLENPKYFWREGGRMICGVYTFELFKRVHDAPLG